MRKQQATRQRLTPRAQIACLEERKSDQEEKSKRRAHVTFQIGKPLVDVLFLRAVVPRSKELGPRDRSRTQEKRKRAKAKNKKRRGRT